MVILSYVKVYLQLIVFLSKRTWFAKNPFKQIIFANLGNEGAQQATTQAEILRGDCDDLQFLEKWVNLLLVLLSYESESRLAEAIESHALSISNYCRWKYKSIYVTAMHKEKLPAAIMAFSLVSVTSWSKF